MGCAAYTIKDRLLTRLQAGGADKRHNKFSTPHFQEEKERLQAKVNPTKTNDK